MTRVLALTLREIAERKLIFLGAAILGVITLLVPLTPVPKEGSYRDIVDLAALIFAVAIYLSGCVMMGATTIGKDLSTGRISFFLTRPFRAVEIWSGRMLGALLTAVLAAGVVAIPATLAGGGLLHFFGENPGDGFANLLAAPILLMLVAHYVSVALRSRSAWLMLDIVALCGATAFLWVQMLRFLPYWGLTGAIVGTAMAVLALYLAIAGWAGLARGRVDPVAVHRWTAITFWSLVAVVLIVIAVWSAWVFSATPEELDWSKSWATEIDGNGEWIAVGTGDSKGRGGIPHEYLISSRTGAWVRLDRQVSVAVSADRRVAVIARRSWIWAFSGRRVTTMEIVDLTAAKPKPRDLAITLNSIVWNVALSSDGSRLAIVESRQVSVYSLPERKLLAAIPLDGKGWKRATFVDANTLQIAAQSTDTLTVSRFDIGRREFIARVPLPYGGRGHLFDSTGQRVILHHGGENRVLTTTLYESASGAKLGDIANAASANGRRSAWLADGGIAVARTRDVAPHVAVYARDGSERLRVGLPDAKLAAIVGEQRPGELVVVWSDNANFAEPCKGNRRAGVIDLASGAMREIEFDGWPASYYFGTMPPPGGASTRLFSTCDGKLVMLDAATGAMKTLLGGK